jgi:four helix bundle protein
MKERDLKIRTRMFAIAVLKLIDKFPNLKSAGIIANQLGRSATGVAVNYRAACRARSHKEFIAKIGIVEEEADESEFWLDVTNETQNISKEELNPLLIEAKELTAIFTSASKTAKNNRDAQR